MLQAVNLQMRNKPISGVILLVAAFAATGFAADNLTSADNAMVRQLTTRGVESADGKLFQLPLPTLPGGKSAADQEAALSSYAKDKGVDRFYSGSIAAPFAFEIKSLDQLTDGAQVRRIDVHFVAKGTIDEVSDRKLLDELATQPGSDENVDIPQSSRQLSEAETADIASKAGDQVDGSHVAYGSSQVNLLDKVYLDIVTATQSLKTSDSVTLAIRLDPDLATATKLPSTWQPIERHAGKLQLAEPKEPFYAAAGYLKATALKNRPGMLLVEIHVLFVEPKGWFDGKNLLASKLPPVIQDSVRSFRRKLIQ